MVPERAYTVTLKDRDVKMTSRDLAMFRDRCAVTSGLAVRMSELILLDMYILDTVFGVSPDAILGAISEVELGEHPSGVKAATQFRNMPLKGLWHKHYFSAHFVLKNIVLELGKTGAEKIIKEVVNPAKSTVLTLEMIDEFSHRISHDTFEARETNKKLTGEWIIYLQHEGNNYYLCCNTHDAGDQFIYERIMKNCVWDFPNLPTWLNAQQTT